MNEKLISEKGVTLVEMLAVIVLISIISIFTTSLIITTIDTTRDVQIESQFRDEADLIVSKLMKELYSAKQANIIQNDTGNVDSCTKLSTESGIDSCSYLIITTDLTKCKRDDTTKKWNIYDEKCKETLKKIGFETKKELTNLVIKDEKYTVLHDNIKIINDSKIIGDPNTTNSYDVLLKLQYSTERRGKEILKTIEFKNTILPY